MRPSTPEKHLGIEIECFTDVNDRDVRKVLRDMNLSKYVEVGYDCSINTEQPEQFGYEFRVLLKEKELKDVVFKVGKFLKRIGAEVNSSCGLHVHLDMRHRGVLSCAEKLYHSQDVMLRTVTKARLDGDYCTPKNEGYYGHTEVIEFADSSHHNAVNVRDAYDTHKTIEVRMHEGTVDPMEIYRWITFLLKVINAKETTKAKVTSYGKRVEKYLRERIARARREDRAEARRERLHRAEFGSDLF